MEYCRDDREPNYPTGECGRYDGGLAERKTCKGGDCGAAGACMVCPGNDNVRQPDTYRRRRQLRESNLNRIVRKVIREAQLLLEIQYCGPHKCTDQQACAYNSTCDSCGASHHGSTGHKCVDMHNVVGTDGKDTRTHIRRSDSDRLRRKPNSPQARFRGGLGNSL
tara:strand:- start:388 stop:882 length:495 start_codon:yes stop_codon:yes gene_type:complete